MALTRKRKEQLVSGYTEVLNQAKGFVIVQSSGMTVKDVEGLRRIVRGAGGQYMVTKNTLLTKVLETAGWPVPEELLKGPTAVAFAMDNFPGVAKAVFEYTADPLRAEKLKVTGGVMADTVFTAAQVNTISKLPSLDELRAEIIGLVVAPAQGIVNVIQSANSSVVNVLQAYLDKHGDGEAA